MIKFVNVKRQVFLDTFLCSVDYIPKVFCTTIFGVNYHFRTHFGINPAVWVIGVNFRRIANPAERGKMNQLFGVDNISDFLDDIDDISSPIYNFIKVE